jgi:hypothetical protein
MRCGSFTDAGDCAGVCLDGGLTVAKSFDQIADDWCNSVRAKLRALSGSREVYRQVLDAFSKIELANVTFDGTSLDLTATGDRHKLSEIVRILRRHGFSSSIRPGPKDTSYSTFFDHASGAKIWLSFSSIACRRVQVGTEMVEQAIYEIVCDEQVFT